MPSGIANTEKLCSEAGHLFPLVLCGFNRLQETWFSVHPLRVKERKFSTCQDPMNTTRHAFRTPLYSA
jgi:hypothetical protein